MTQPAVLLDAAAYIAPEQAAATGGQAQRHLAFGAVLYQLLSGERAFEGDAITETFAAVMTGTPKSDALAARTPGRRSVCWNDVSSVM